MWNLTHEQEQRKYLMLQMLKNIQYSKLIITFFAHLFVALLYGSFLALLIQEEYGAPLWLSVTLQLFIIALVTYVAYQEEVKRHYPFLKAVGVNFLGFVLWFGVAFTKIYILNVIALIIVLFAIRYRCKKCVEYRRYSFG